MPSLDIVTSAFSIGCCFLFCFVFPRRNFKVAFSAWRKRGQLASHYFLAVHKLIDIAECVCVFSRLFQSLRSVGEGLTHVCVRACVRACVCVCCVRV